MKHKWNDILSYDSVKSALYCTLSYLLSFSLVYGQVVSATPRHLIRTDDFQLGVKKLKLKKLKTIGDLYRRLEKVLPQDTAHKWKKILAASMNQPMPPVDIKSTFVDQEHVKDIKVTVNAQGKVFNIHMFPREGVLYKIANTEFSNQDLRTNGGYSQLHHVISPEALKSFDLYFENYGKPLSQEALLKVKKHKLKNYLKVLDRYFDAVEDVVRFEKSQKTSWYSLDSLMKWLLPVAVAGGSNHKGHDGDSPMSENDDTLKNDAETECKRDHQSLQCIKKCKKLNYNPQRGYGIQSNVCAEALEKTQKVCAQKTHQPCRRLAAVTQDFEEEKQAVTQKEEKRSGLGFLPLLAIAALVGVGLYFLLRKKKKKSSPPVVSPPAPVGKAGENEVVRDPGKTTNEGDGTPTNGRAKTYNDTTTAVK